MSKLPPALSDRLYLVRHGESTCNTVHRIAGLSDVPLNGLGRAQAEKAGRDWGGQGFDVVFVSPLKRAGETASLVCAAMAPAPPVVVDPALAERDFGSYTLQNKAILQRRYGVSEYERAMNGDSDTMDGGESAAEFRQRITTFYEQTLLPALRDGRRVLVVSHKYVIEFISRLVLGLDLESAHDLRLPNSQFICAANLDRYIAGEVKWRNEFYDKITVNYPVVLTLAALTGFLLHLAGLREAVSPIILIILLSLATAIGFTTVQIEELGRYIRHKDTLRANAWRYGAAPIALALVAYLSGALSSPWALAIVAFFAAPAGVIAVTASRCSGGLILPTLAAVMISSAISVVPLAFVLANGTGDRVAEFVLICLGLFFATLYVPYLVVLVLRTRRPIRTARFGLRNGHLAVLLIALYVLLAMLGIDLPSALDAGLLAVGLAVVIKFATLVILRHSGLFAVDLFSAMTYPNAFILVVIGMLLDQPFLTHVATWYLIPMSILATVDNRFANARAAAQDGEKLASLLQVPLAPDEGRAGTRR